MRTEEINQSLERTITRARLKKYLDATGDDLDAALALYEHNIRLAEALYTSFQGLEICLRNTLDFHMKAAYGSDWLASSTAPLNQDARNAISQATAELTNPTHDKIVAELKFSFWVSLLARRYDNSLWRKALHKAFRAKSGKKRSDVHSRMNALRRFRNRVAHHEPVFDKASQMHSEALEAIEWMCLDTHKWIAACSQFDTTHNS